MVLLQTWVKVIENYCFIIFPEQSFFEKSFRIVYKYNVLLSVQSQQTSANFCNEPPGSITRIPNITADFASLALAGRYP